MFCPDFHDATNDGSIRPFDGFMERRSYYALPLVAHASVTEKVCQGPQRTLAGLLVPHQEYLRGYSLINRR